VRRRRLAASSLLLFVLGLLLGTPAAAATSTPATTAPASTPATRQVVLLLVPRSSWADLPDRFDGWAKANMAISTANSARRESDIYLTISKGGRSSGLGNRFGTGPMRLDGDRLTIAAWPRFVAHDKDLRYAGDLGALGEAVRRAGITATAITQSSTSAALTLVDRRGVVERAIPGGGGLQVAAEVQAGTGLVVAETSLASLPFVLDAIGAGGAKDGTCTIVASASMPRGRRALGAFAASPACGLGRERLVSASTRQPDYVVLADLLPTTLRVLGIDGDLDDEGSVIRPVAGRRSVDELVDRSDRARVAARSAVYFNTIAVGAALLGLFASVMDGRWRRRWGACLLALPGAMVLIQLVSWWRWGPLAGVSMAVGAALVIGGAVDALLGRRPRLVVALLASSTAVILGLDVATGGLLELDSGIANNAIGAGRFAGMGNVPYGYFVAACLLTAGIALERWGRRAVAPLVVALGVAVVVDGAPTLGADVGGVIAAVPAYALLLTAWRRRLPLMRLAMLAVSGVVVLAAFAAFDVSRPEGRMTHLGRTLTNGELGDTIIRRELAALQSFQRSTWCVVLLVALVGLTVMWEQLPRTRPLQVTLAAIGVAAFLGTFVNDSGVAVAGGMAAVAWPAHVLLLRTPDVSEASSTDTAAPRRPSRSAGSAAGPPAR
jgi:hypothetical protein